MRTFRRCLAATVLVAATLAAPARAADGDTTFRSCVAASNPDCTAEPLTAGSYGVTVSPDGKFAYFASTFSGNNALLVYSVNQSTGKLTRVAGANGCVKDTPSAGDCGDAHDMVDPIDLVMNATGSKVYVAAYNSNAILVFDRNATTGKLTQVSGLNGCVHQGAATADCKAGRSMGRPVGLTMSPDGKNVYAVHDNPGAITTFDRNGTTGGLTQKNNEAGCINNAATETCGQGRALSGFAVQVTVAPDGRHVYAPSVGNSAVLLFNRDTTTGEITQKTGTQGCISRDGSAGGTAGQCQDGSDDLDGAVGLTFGGNDLYVFTGRGVVYYGRSSSTGNLTQKGCVSPDGSAGLCTDGVNAGGLWAGRFSPDGRDLAVEQSFFGGATFFRRNTSTGALTQVSSTARCATNGGSAQSEGAGFCRDVSAMGGYGLPFWHPNGLFVYAGQNTGNSVVTFERDFAPTCSNVAASVPHNTTVGVKLSCSDKNGDALTYSITRAPAAGQLGAINQGAASLFYSPFNGFSGADSFDYRASANGATSNTARASLSVAGPPPAPPGPGPGPGPGPSVPLTPVPSTTSFSSLAFTKFTKFVNLSANNLVAGTTVTVTCKTKKKKQQKKGCPYKRKRFTTAVGRAKLNLRKPFKGKKVPVGTKITITISAPNFITKRITYTIRKRKRPSSRVQCIAPGQKPGSCV